MGTSSLHLSSYAAVAYSTWSCSSQLALMLVRAFYLETRTLTTNPLVCFRFALGFL